VLDVPVPKTLDGDAVHIWFRFTTSLGEPELSEAVGLLSPSERERCARFMFDDDRRDFAVGHALLRTTLSLYDGRPPGRWSFETNAYGRPFIERDLGRAHRLLFSLSHTRGLVACAVTSGADVGVDVASVDRAADPGRVSEQWFSASEISQLERCSQAERPVRFIELWALKEAFVKAIGLGLSFPCSGMTFDLTRERAIVFTPPVEYSGHVWRCALFGFGSRYRLALVVDGVRDRLLHVTAMPAGGRSAESPVLIGTSW
jgi:4'-phosphopantetheinyl transferase